MFPRKKVKKSVKDGKERSENLRRLLKHRKRDGDGRGDVEEVDDDEKQEQLDVAINEMKANELEAIEVEILRKRAKKEAPARGYQGASSIFR